MWQETEQGLYRKFTFTNFKEAFAFMERVAAVAEKQGHHPRWRNEWNVVEVWLSTHEAGGSVTDKDKALAGAIDEVISRA
jgi:4a-hydroxytetrahydrobiopterin dehydratase